MVAVINVVPNSITIIVVHLRVALKDPLSKIDRGTSSIAIIVVHLRVALKDPLMQ